MPARPQGTDHPSGVRPDRVVEQQGAGGLVVDRDEDASSAVSSASRRRTATPARRRRPRTTQAAVADARRVGRRPSFDAVHPACSTTLRGTSAEAPLPGSPHDGRGSTWGDTWSREAARPRTSARQTVGGDDLPIAGWPGVSVPVLSNSSTSAASQALQRPAALHDHARAGLPVRARPRSRPARRGSAGTGSPRPGRRRHAGVAGDQPRRAGQQGTTRTKITAITVGQRARTAALGGLRLLDEPDDPRVGGSRRVVVASRSNGPPAFTAPLRTMSPAARSHRECLAGQADSSSTASRGSTMAVDGHDLARSDQHMIASPNVLDRNLFDGDGPPGAVGRPVGDAGAVGSGEVGHSARAAWGPLHQETEIAPGPVAAPWPRAPGR